MYRVTAIIRRAVASKFVLRRCCRSRGALRVLIAVFAHKQIGRLKPIKADFCGVTLPNRYVFGFGMDVHGYWRNLPAVYALHE